MLTIEQLRKIDLNLANLSDEEVGRIRDDLYELADIIFEKYRKEHKCKEAKNYKTLQT